MRDVSLITAIFGGATGAWVAGMPPFYSALITVAGLVAVLVVKGAELTDARTRRYQAETDRMVALRQNSKHQANALSPPPTQVEPTKAHEASLPPSKKRKRSVG